jgi:hypothetical protein
MQKSLQFITWCLFTAQHVSSVPTPIIRSSTTAVADSGLPLERGDSSAVVRGRAGRPDHEQQHCYHHTPKLEPEAATAVIELLKMGVGTPETCWAVNKHQVINWRDCCIWLVNLFDSSCVIVNVSGILSFNHSNLSRHHFCPTTTFSLYFALVFVSHFTPRCKSLALTNLHYFPGAIQNISFPAISSEGMSNIWLLSLWSVNDYSNPTSTFIAGYADFGLHVSIRFCGEM